MNRFTYPELTAVRQEALKELSDRLRGIETILNTFPRSREQSIALTHLEESFNWMIKMFDQKK